MQMKNRVIPGIKLLLRLLSAYNLFSAAQYLNLGMTGKALVATGFASMAFLLSLGDLAKLWNARNKSVKELIATDGTGELATPAAFRFAVFLTYAVLLLGAFLQ
jgi:hypothetical protein